MVCLSFHAAGIFYKTGSVHPSILVVFSWDWIISFLFNFDMVLETVMKLGMTAVNFRKTFFSSVILKMGQR